MLCPLKSSNNRVCVQSSNAQFFVVLFLFSSVLCATAVSAQERGCTRGKPTPVLDTAEAYRFIGSPDSLSQEEKFLGVRALEEGRLPSKRSVEIRHVGCAHYGLEWRFEMDTDTLNSQRSLLREASNLMSEVAEVSRGNGEREREIAAKLRSLADQDSTPEPPYRLGMNRQIADVQVENAGERAVLIVAYDIAL